MDINELRSQIDETDSVLLDAFCRRMDVSARLAVYKKEKSIPVYDPARERQKLCDVLSKTPEELRTYVSALYFLLFDLSRSYQGKILNPEAPLIKDITGAIENTNKLFPRDAVVACQGIEGAYCAGLRKVFAFPNIIYCTTSRAFFQPLTRSV